MRSLIIVIIAEGIYYLGISVLMGVGLCFSTECAKERENRPFSPIFYQFRQKQHHYWIWKFMCSLITAVAIFHFLMFSIWSVSKSELQIQNLQTI